MMSQYLQVGDLVSFAHNDNMFTGSIIANVKTGLDNGYCFRVQTKNVIEHGKHREVKGFCVDYPASALRLIRLHGC